MAIFGYIFKGILLLIVVGIGGFGLVFGAVFVLSPLFGPRGPSAKDRKGPVNPYAGDPKA